MTDKELAQEIQVVVDLLGPYAHVDASAFDSNSAFGLYWSRGRLSVEFVHGENHSVAELLADGRSHLLIQVAEALPTLVFSVYTAHKTEKALRVSAEDAVRDAQDRLRGAKAAGTGL